MKTLTWEYPSSLDQLSECLKKDTRPHGGGTGIMRNIPQSGSIADLSRLGLDYVTIERDTARIGATASYARTAKVIGDHQRGHILSRALIDTASPALRNRITVGGSIALFPPWGRIVGPLVALDAELSLIGGNAGDYPVATYVNTPDLAEKSAITEVRVDVGRAWNGYFYRFSPSKLAYPLFSLVVLTEVDGKGHLGDSRIVVSGVRGRYKRLKEVESMARGSSPADIRITEEDLGVSFPDRQGFTGDYLAHLAAVEVRRGLAAAGSENGHTSTRGGAAS